MASSYYQSTDPRTAVSFQDWEHYTKAETDQVLQDLVVSQISWENSTQLAREQFCRKAEKAILAKLDDLAMLASQEMGKNLLESKGEIRKCASLATYCADHLASALKSERITIDGAHAATHYRPLGIILGVMPWNFPYWQAARFALPTIAAGNTCILKHAPNVQGCAEAFVKILNEAAGVTVIFNLRVDNDSVAELIADSRVAGVSLTGSTRAGKAVAKAAGEAIKPSLLELGGSDPYLILADADLDLAEKAVCAGRMLNAGQSCISAKRIIVVREIADEFAARISAFAKTISFVSSNPKEDKEGQLAPMARHDLRENLHDQVKRSVAAGAKLEVGGTLPEGPGYFYPFTVLTKVQPGQPAFDEELFGPVFTLIEARDTEHAIELANTSQYGLGAAVFSQDLAKAEEIAKNRIHAGSCFVNAFVHSDPRLPFGGVKQSGYGRELATAGLRSFTNLKTVFVSHQG